MGFQDLNVSKQILMALEEAGFENPTPIQEEVFSVSRSGRDLIGIAQTGTGKTLAYLIPMLMKLHYAQGLVPRALVVVPTRELVVQVCESVELLTEFMDIRCVGVYGGTNIRTQQDRVFEGVDLLVATPGRFMDIYYNGIIRTKMIRDGRGRRGRSVDGLGVPSATERDFRGAAGETPDDVVFRYFLGGRGELVT